MLPRRNRLSRHAFPTDRGGMRSSTAHFSAVWGPSRHGGGAAAVVSKKVARRSVDRHLLKRRMLEAMRPYALPDRYLVVYAKGGSQTLAFRAVVEELTALLRKTLLHPAHP